MGLRRGFDNVGSKAWYGLLFFIVKSFLPDIHYLLFYLLLAVGHGRCDLNHNYVIVLTIEQYLVIST